MFPFSIITARTTSVLIRHSSVRILLSMTRKSGFSRRSTSNTSCRLPARSPFRLRYLLRKPGDSASGCVFCSDFQFVRRKWSLSWTKLEVWRRSIGVKNWFSFFWLEPSDIVVVSLGDSFFSLEKNVKVLANLGLLLFAAADPDFCSSSKSFSSFLRSPSK